LTFEVRISPSARRALILLNDEEYEWCKGRILSLAENPFPGTGGDKEKLSGKINRYRLHIGRSYTAIYRIEKEKKLVCVQEFGYIGEMHKTY